MLRSSAHLPACGGRLVDASGEEVLAKKPAETGEHMWVKVQKEAGLGTNQVRQALARSVQISPELVSDAGNRERQGRFVQWFSLPLEPIDNPGPIKRAGAHGKMQVLKVTHSHKPFTTACVERIKWKFRLKGGNLDGGYQKAKAILDYLRTAGVPNYVPAARLGPDGQFVRWGKLVLRGERLPAAVTRGGEVTPGSCLKAVQDSLFNQWVTTRMTDGLLGRTVLGDVLQGRLGHSELVHDPVHADKRVATWEATVLGPLFGSGMITSEGEARAREIALLDAADIPAVARFDGGRRTLRFQPQRAILDLDGDDILLSCEVNTDVSIHVLVNEFAPSEDLA
jgi:tRNA pseudouridine13 synthase